MARHPLRAARGEAPGRKAFQRDQQFVQQGGIQPVFVHRVTRYANRSRRSAHILGHAGGQAQIDADTDYGGMGSTRQQFNENAAELAAVLENVVGPFQGDLGGTGLLQCAGDSDTGCQGKACRGGARRKTPEQGKSQAVAGAGEPGTAAPAAAGGLLPGDDHRAGGRTCFGAVQQYGVGRVATGQDIDIEAAGGGPELGGDGGDSGRHEGIP